ncbi:hypothetical protein P0Y43_21410 [Pseudomonas entomophila]|uniref:hypothetical protein n=1 Tax=Pseudomonas entomophila TaxID=312306 RepID=UPI0023D7CEC5|nr:hypothetical protein [Pseudomonas entomophila]MDF0733257.1 hypothetical protein [Pseudomonas entomophila]
MDDTRTLYRAAGAIVHLSNTADVIHRQDILDTILFAQLFASRQYDPFDEADDWARACVTSLSKLHWTLASSRSTVESLTTPFDAISQIKETLEPSEQELSDVLKQLSIETIRDLQPHCTRALDGVLHVKLAIASSHEKDKLHFKSLLYSCASSFNEDWLNQTNYAAVRTPVLARLTTATFKRTEDFSAVRNKVISALGSQRTKEIQPIQPAVSN